MLTTVFMLNTEVAFKAIFPIWPYTSTEGVTVMSGEAERGKQSVGECKRMDKTIVWSLPGEHFGLDLRYKKKKDKPPKILAGIHLRACVCTWPISFPHPQGYGNRK